MSFDYHKMRAGLIRQLSAAVARGIDSMERGDLADLDDQLHVIREILDRHGELLPDVIDSLEVDRFVKVFERAVIKENICIG